MAKQKKWDRVRGDGGKYVAWEREIASLVTLEIQEENHGFEPPCDTYKEEPNGYGIVLAVSLWVRDEMVLGPKYSSSLLGAKMLATNLEKEWKKAS